MQRLIYIVSRLRGPGGCSWDQEQDHHSLLPHLLEEVYEVIEEIQENRLDDTLADELGDLLLQVVLHTQIASEDNRFYFDDVVSRICAKMIRRHPHVFAQANKNQSLNQLSEQWDRIKAEEKQSNKLFDDIPKSKPALLRAKKIGDRAAKLGFDWPDHHGVLEKIEEELAEVKIEINAQDMNALESEIGDLLHSVVNLSRHFKINPELALQKSNKKFIRRFAHVEQGIQEAKEKDQSLSLNEMEALWQAAKNNEA